MKKQENFVSNVLSIVRVDTGGGGMIGVDIMTTSSVSVRTRTSYCYTDHTVRAERLVGIIVILKKRRVGTVALPYSGWLLSSCFLQQISSNHMILRTQTVGGWHKILRL